MTIKETAGKIILYFYQLQRTVPASMPYRQIGFIDKTSGSVSMTSDKKWLTKDLLDICSQPSDVYNAFMFLIDKGFVRSLERTATGKRVYVGIRVTADGIDTIEGVERGEEGRQNFTNTFNIAIERDTSVDELIKENLSRLLDAE